MKKITSDKPIPNIKQGDIISFDYNGDSHTALVFRKTSDGELRLISLNHKCSVWVDIEKWWFSQMDNGFDNIEVLNSGTILVVT